MLPGYCSTFSSPRVHASPRSICSIRRKPVPRYLHPPNHDASAPSTPLYTPIPDTPSSLPSRATTHTTTLLRQPHLPTPELILKSCGPSRASKRGVGILPIGQGHCQQRPGSSGRGQHRRSMSEYVHGHRGFEPIAPKPMYTCQSGCSSMTQLSTRVAVPEPFNRSQGL